MEASEIKKLERVAEDTQNETESKAAMLKLRNINPTYHWCAEWDYAVICDRHQEWNSCLCELPNGEGRLDKITVYGTKEGKLYIKPDELFALPKVQGELKRAMVRSVTSEADLSMVRVKLLETCFEIAEKAKQVLRDKGYGWTGLDILETCKLVPKNPENEED